MDAGVVDQDVEAPELCHRIVHRLLHACRIGHVQVEGDGLGSPSGIDALGYCLSVRLEDIRHRYAGAMFRVGFGDSAPDAAP